MPEARSQPDECPCVCVPLRYWLAHYPLWAHWQGEAEVSLNEEYGVIRPRLLQGRKLTRMGAIPLTSQAIDIPVRDPQRRVPLRSGLCLL